ncbi:MAG: endoglucanase [Lachnospiraceae bacterium]|nr:endoglucanase [Lachnospiraceae bacterium]
MSKGSLSYKYYHAPIPGGGYVTGFAYDPAEKGILYCRTDIGGSYRYSYEDRRWYCLNEGVGMEDLSETFPIAIASYKKRLYIICGDGREVGWNPGPEEEVKACGRLCISDDLGNSFVYEDIPCYVHGNLCGRSSGKRMVITESGRIFFASQRDGLGIRDAEGKWSFKPVCGESFLTFVWVSPDEKTVVAGTAGISRRSGKRRGHSLYASFDGGESFTPLSEPEDPSDEMYGGSVALRYAVDERYLYVSYCCSCPNVYAGWMGYACDGGDVRNGRLARYLLAELTKAFEDITPEADKMPLTYAMGGVAAASGGFICSAGIGNYGGYVIWVSRDCGEHWKVALKDLELDNITFRAPYLRPELHSGHSPVHWMTDLGLDPHDPDKLWFNTGTGVFLSENFTKDERCFSDHCDGIEETVHMNLYSPPSGEVKLLDLVGDLGGFAFRDLHSPCDRPFVDEKMDRYITCINADFPDADPSKFIVTARGNWISTTKGGLIYSKDNGENWKRLALPYGINDELDGLCESIERPNTNPGWVAVSADASCFVFTLAEGITLKRRNTVRAELSEDGSVSYSAVSISAEEDKNDTPCMKVFADRTDPSYFYGFGEDSRLYVSSDGGRSFSEKPSLLPAGIQFGLIDCADKTEIRGDAGFSGRFYLALEKHGLWLLEYDREKDAFNAERLTKEGERVFRCGLGILDKAYTGMPKMIYINGIIDGHYGFYRSPDNGKSWQLLNDEEHRYGDINSIEGDSRHFGRFFIGSGSFGVIVGEEE